MKFKYLLAVVCICIYSILISSCVRADGKEMERVNHNLQPYRSVRPNEREVPAERIIHFQYRGHKYIKFSGGYQAGIVHDPDCPCGKSK